MDIKKTLCSLSVLLLLAGCSANKTSENITVKYQDDKVIVKIEGKGTFEHIYSDADNSNVVEAIKESTAEKLKVKINEDGTVSLTAKGIPNGASLTLSETEYSKEGRKLVGKWELICRFDNLDEENEGYEPTLEEIVEMAKNESNEGMKKETLTFHEDGKLDVWKEGYNGFSGTYSVEEEGLKHNSVAPDVFTSGSKFLVNDEYFAFFVDGIRCEVYQKID